MPNPPAPPAPTPTMASAIEYMANEYREWSHKATVPGASVYPDAAAILAAHYRAALSAMRAVEAMEREGEKFSGDAPAGLTNAEAEGWALGFDACRDKLLAAFPSPDGGSAE